MKEVLNSQSSSGFSNHFANNNGDTSNASSNNVANGENSRRYAVLSTEWVSAIGEELGMHPLPDPLLRRLAEDASYRLREVLHKCVTRLRHSKRRRLTSNDVNAVFTNLCDVDPIFGAPEQMPEYHTEAAVFVPHDHIIDLPQQVNNPQRIEQLLPPLLQETEITDARLREARDNYAKRAIKTIFNGSHKTFQVLLNDCATNANLGGYGVVDKLMSIARAMVIANSTHYTRISMRTCQLILAVASNSEAVYPYHLVSVDKLTELLIELPDGYIHTNMEVLFKECAFKLMLRWPSAADKFIPVLEGMLCQEVKDSFESRRKKLMAMELIAGVQPLLFFQHENNSPLSLENVLNFAAPGSVLWLRIAIAVGAFVKTGNQPLNYSVIYDHYGDSILSYMVARNEKRGGRKEPVNLPMIVRSKINTVSVRPIRFNKIYPTRHSMFPDSMLQGRQEIRFAFVGGRPVPPDNLKRASLRADYEFLRSEVPATVALVASKRLLIFKNKRKNFANAYNLGNINL